MPGLHSQKILLNPVFFLALCLSLFACRALKPVTVSTNRMQNFNKNSSKDKYLWLEEIESQRSLDWVKKQNTKSISLFEKDSRFEETLKTIQNNLLSPDRIPKPELAEGKIENHWTDKDHPRGLWRTTILDSYKSTHPEWQLILDIDELNKKENKSWVFKGSECLKEDSRLCLVFLSDGGSDAVVVREFDKESKTFIKDSPFNLEKAKSYIEWIDKDTTLVSTDFGPNSLTKSNYPRLLKVWKRGQKLSEAKTIKEASKEDMSIGPIVIHQEDTTFALAETNIDFYTREYSLLDLKNFTSSKIEIPTDSEILGILKDHLVFKNRSEIKTESLTIAEGSILSKKINESDLNYALIYSPQKDEALKEAFVTKDFLIVSYLKNVLGRVKLFTLNEKGMPQISRELDLPKEGTLEIVSHEKKSNHFIFSYENFLTPQSFYFFNGKESLKIKQAPKRFDESNLVFSQQWAKSKDGTSIPYFIVHSKNIVLDGTNPTLLYGYGGFEDAMTPVYLANFSPWLKQNGVYVLANLRGGGEFGPEWHTRGIKENKQKVFDDFYAIAEKLISDKVTSAKKLGIMGGSNGGLLVGAAMTQRPELFQAVVCQVPLLDMLRYHLLLAGASWIAEYGDPSIPNEYSYIQKYSPYQNLKKKAHYPNSYFFTTTKDDRVHPGHARKMVAKLNEYGQNVTYFENPEGGHGAGADPLQQSKTRTYQLIYLFQQLMN